MNSIQQIIEIQKAVLVLSETPAAKLKANKKIMEDVKAVFNTDFFNRLISNISTDFQNESLSKVRESNKTLMNTESLEFLRKLAAFRNVEATKKAVGAPSRYTTLIGRMEAFNQIKTPPNIDYSFKEAKEFEEAYNSIFSDKALQIGTAKDPTIMGSYIDYSPYIYNYQYYLSIPTLSQTIDKPIQIATRDLPEIVTEDEELTKELVKYFHRMRTNDKIQKMLSNSSLSPRGSVLVPIAERARVRFNVFNDTQFTYSVSPNYNKIDFRDGGYGVSSIFVLGHSLQNGVTCFFLCPGFEPIYGVGKNRIFQLKDAAEAINIYLYTIKVLCIRAQVLVQKWGGEGQNDTLLQKMQKLSDDINSKLSLSTALKLPQDAELQILNNNINEGFAKISPIIKEYQGMLSGVMPDFFYGSDTAYSANSFNIHATHQNIRSEIQEAQIEPMYRFIINTLLQYDERFTKWQKHEDQFEIKFKSLYEPTDKEKAEVESTRIENIIKMADYPDLADIFKAQGLLPKEYKLPEKSESDGDPGT